MRKTAEILEGGREHVDACMRIGMKLPEYFNAGGLEAMRRDLSDDALYVALEEGEVVGFLTIRGKGDGVAEISWLAVDPERQGNGVGRALVGRIEDDLAAHGMRMLVVKTLAEGADHPPYEATRLFYEHLWFLHLETVNPYPPWDEEPAAIYAKALSDREVR